MIVLFMILYRTKSSSSGNRGRVPRGLCAAVRASCLLYLSIPSATDKNRRFRCSEPTRPPSTRLKFDAKMRVLKKSRCARCVFALRAVRSAVFSRYTRAWPAALLFTKFRNSDHLGAVFGIMGHESELKSSIRATVECSSSMTRLFC